MHTQHVQGRTFLTKQKTLWALTLEGRGSPQDDLWRATGGASHSGALGAGEEPAVDGAGDVGGGQSGMGSKTGA